MEEFSGRQMRGFRRLKARKRAVVCPTAKSCHFGAIVLKSAALRHRSGSKRERWGFPDVFFLEAGVFIRFFWKRVFLAEPLCPRASAEVKKGRSILVKIPKSAV